MQRLSVPTAEPFTTLTDEATHWGDELPRQWEGAGPPFEPELVDRARGWAFAQTVAWAFGDEGAVPAHVQTARWPID